MNNLDCTIILKNDDKEISPKDIFDKVMSAEVKKYSVTYDKPVNHQICYLNNEPKNIIITSKDEIDSNVKGVGIYFILNENENKILYIGKSNDLKTRLTQHLLKCSITTHSHIRDVINYLVNCKDVSDKISLKYCFIKTNEKHNAAIEGVLLDYLMESKDECFTDNWNKRKD